MKRTYSSHLTGYGHINQPLGLTAAYQTFIKPARLKRSVAQMQPFLLSRKGQNGLLIATDVGYKLRAYLKRLF